MVALRNRGIVVLVISLAAVVGGALLNANTNAPDLEMVSRGLVAVGVPAMVLSLVAVLLGAIVGDE